METNNKGPLSIGEKVKQIRKDKGLTLAELQNLSGLSKTYLSELENGKASNPTITSVRKIAKGLRINVGTLVEKDKGFSTYESPFVPKSKKKMDLSEAALIVEKALNDPHISLKYLHEMENMIISFATWLRDTMRNKTREERET